MSRPGLLLNKQLLRIALLVCAFSVAACGKIAWKEEVQLQNGELIIVKRTAKSRAFGEVGGAGGWENEGMSVEVIHPVKPDNPPPWNGKFVPLLFDRDAQTSEWFMVATFYSCQSWYDLGRPKLPYTEYRLRNGTWVQQSLSSELIGRKGNMLTHIRSTGEPDHTIASKAYVLVEHEGIAPKYKSVVNQWSTGC